MIGPVRIPFAKSLTESQEIRLSLDCLVIRMLVRCCLNVLNEYLILTTKLNLIWSPPRQPVGNNQASWMRVGEWGRFASVIDFCHAVEGTGMSSSIQLCVRCVVFLHKYPYICTTGLWTDIFKHGWQLFSANMFWSDDLHYQNFSRGSVNPTMKEGLQKTSRSDR